MTSAEKLAKKREMVRRIVVMKRLWVKVWFSVGGAIVGLECSGVRSVDGMAILDVMLALVSALEDDVVGVLGLCVLWWLGGTALCRQIGRWASGSSVAFYCEGASAVVFRPDLTRGM